MKTASLLMASLAAAGCASSTLDERSMEAPRSLAAAETAFAAHSVREDMRVAFMANFAEDGVYVRNGWTVANAFLRTQAAPAIVLDWKPVYAETAASGDFGLSTGPWKLTRKADLAAAPSYGQFVSIWKRDGDGPWKVAVDIGIAHAAPVFWERTLQTAVVGAWASPEAGDIANAEALFARNAATGGAPAAYRAHGAVNLRFYRGEAAPIVGLQAALASAAMKDEKLVYTIERMETARSGDFGYARGSYAAASAPAAPMGYFMRVWRLESGEWKVALDVTNPAR